MQTKTLFTIFSVTVSSVDCSKLPLSGCNIKFDAQENSNHYVSVTVATNNSDTVQFAISVDLQGINTCHQYPCVFDIQFCARMSTVSSQRWSTPGQLHQHISAVW